MQALLDAKSRYNAQPRLLIAPGHTSKQPVATAADSLAGKLRAVAVIDGPNTDDEAAIAYAKNFGSKRLYMVDPGARATCDALDLLADLLGRADERAGELAKIADERGIAGQQCERSYDALIGDVQTNLPQ
jgi:phage tail sheath protein FI